MKKKILFWLSVGTLVSGCAGTPVTRYYVLHMNGNDLPSTTSQISIGIAPFSIEPIYSNYKIAYRESPYQIQFYHYHQWASDPAKMVEGCVVDYLRTAGRFKKVSQSPSSENVDVIINGHILKFEEWDEGETWYGTVAMEFQAFSNKDKRIIWKGEISRKIPADSRQPISVVKALSSAAQEITQELSERIQAEYRLAARNEE